MLYSKCIVILNLIMASFLSYSCQGSIKNIIFDVGGVLVNWDPQKLVNDLKANDPGVPSNILDIAASQSWKEYDRGILDQDGVIKALQDQYAKERVKAFIDGSLRQLDPSEEGKALFYELKTRGYKIYILSNFSEESMDYCKVKYDYYFLKNSDGAVISYEIKLIKPDLKIYAFLLNKYSIKPEESLFIDDSIKNIEAAKKLGIKGILFKNVKQVHAELVKENIL